MSSLEKYVSEMDEKEIKYLPLFHSCIGSKAESIIIEKKIKATKCKVFDKNLLYFFYGKPSYPVSAKTDKAWSSSNVFNCPVCFVVDVEKIKACDIYPFDTGAYMGNMYKSFSMNPDKTVLKNEYSLGKDVNSIRKYISGMYSDNVNYIEGKSSQYLRGDLLFFDNNQKKEIESIEPSIIRLLELLNCNGESLLDERSRTIEVMTRRSVDLNDVEAIILPSLLERSKYFSEFIKKNKKIKILTYIYRDFTVLDRYYEAIFQKAIDYLKEKGDMHEE